MFSSLYDVAACFVDDSGGALFNTGSLTIHDTVFTENTAANGGLAIMNDKPPVELGNVTFHGNMLSCPPEKYSDHEQVSTVAIYVLALETGCFCSLRYQAKNKS